MPNQSRKITIGLCQMDSVPGDLAANLQTIRACCEIATDEKTQPQRPDLLVFPELATIGYRAAPEVHKNLAQPIVGPLANKLGALAVEFCVGLLVGIAERDAARDDIIYDSALCLDAHGRIVGCYRKSHLFPEGESHFEQGNRLLPLRFSDIELGVMICSDMRAPETARALAVQRAQVLIGLTHWNRDSRHERERLLPARALENFLPLVDVNAYSDDDNPAAPYGGSVAFDDRGIQIAFIDRGSPAVAVVSLDLHPRGIRSLYGTQHIQRRKELYGCLLADPPPTIDGLHPEFATHLRQHDDFLRSSLETAKLTFPKAASGYIGIVDDPGNIQVRHMVGPPGAFVAIRVDQGTAGYAVRTSKTYKWKGDPENPQDPYFLKSASGVRSELVAPIRVGQGVAGVILLDSHDPTGFDEPDAEATLLNIADNIGSVLQRAPGKPDRLGGPPPTGNLRRVLEMAQALLHQPLTNPGAPNAVEEMARRILAFAMDATGALRGNVAILKGDVLKLVAVQGDATNRFKDIDLSTPGPWGIKGWVIKNCKPFYAPNVRGNPDRGFRKVDFYIPTHDVVLSEFVMPLLDDDGSAIGVINLESETEDAFAVELDKCSDNQPIIGGTHFELVSALATIVSFLPKSLPEVDVKQVE